MSESAKPPTPSEQYGTSKKISPFSCVMMLAGSIIGAGIFLSSNYIVQSIPSIFYTLLLWALGGVVAIFLSFCYAELGQRFPMCGGEYEYFIHTYHEFCGFSFMFSQFFFTRPITIAISFLFTANTILEIASVQYNVFYSRLLSVSIVVVVAILHCISNNYSIKFNNVLTSTKFICIAVIVGLALYKLGIKETENIQHWEFQINATAADVAISIYNCMYSYDGFNSLSYLVEEMRDPNRYLLLCSVFGVVLVTGLYLAVNFCYFVLLGVEGMTEATSVVNAAVTPYLRNWSWVVVLLVAISSLGSGNSAAYTGARIYFGAARKGHMPEIVASVHRRTRTVIPSLILQALLTCLFLIASPDVEKLLQYFSAATWIIYSAVILAILISRYRKLGNAVPFQMNAVIIVILLLVAVTFVILGFFQDWLSNLTSIAIFLVSWPLYMVFVYKDGKVLPRKFKAFTNKCSAALINFCNLEVVHYPRLEESSSA